jgi:periplasmic divalent cation tolerance protein
MPLLVVLCTFPDQDTAKQIGRSLVEEGLIACVNLLPGVQSIYRWEGKVESTGEVLTLMKTTEEGYARLEARLKALHPYEVPEIIALPAQGAETAYAKWVSDMTREKSE